MPGVTSTKKRMHSVHPGPIPEFFLQAGISSQLAGISLFFLVGWSLFWLVKVFYWLAGVLAWLARVLSRLAVIVRCEV